MRAKPVEGQIVYSLNVGNAARGKEQALTPMKVVKVGRKYFTCSAAYQSYPEGVRFHLSNWREKSDYSPEHQLYETEQAWEEEHEAERLADLICEKYTYRWEWKNIPFPDLQKIAEILEVT